VVYSHFQAGTSMTLIFFNLGIPISGNFPGYNESVVVQIVITAIFCLFACKRPGNTTYDLFDFCVSTLGVGYTFIKTAVTSYSHSKTHLPSYHLMQVAAW
jgi:hypothetical protein